MVQMKGSGDPSYSVEKNFVSVSLKVSTVNYLLGHDVPVMVCICDTGTVKNPVYYAWLDNAMRHVQSENPSFVDQETVTIRIPTGQIITSAVSDSVYEYVSEHRERLRIGTEILEVMAVASGLGKNQTRTLPASDLMEQAIKPTLVKAGIVELSTEEDSKQMNILSPEDQKRLKEIREISLLLNSFKDDEAHERLAKLEKEVEQADDGVKAAFYNNRGVLSLHTDKNDSYALKFFTTAAQLRPSEAKYTANVLWTEFWRRDERGIADLGDSWQSKLDDVFISNPTFGPVVRLKAMQMARISGYEAATDFLVKSQLWHKEPLDSRNCLVEILKDAAQYDQAIEVVTQTEKEGIPLNPLFYSLAGFVFLMKAVQNDSLNTHLRFSTGPADIRPDLLQESSRYYSLAYKELVSAGLPLPWEDTILNYSMVLSLLGEYDEAVSVTKPFLQRYPASTKVNDALASALFRKGEYENAIPYAEKAFAEGPDSHTLKNLCLCLFLAEDFEELLTVISENRKNGFEDLDEECLLRSLGAIAYHEIGDEEKSQNEIRILKKNGLETDALMVECSIAGRDKTPRETIITILNQAITAHPENHILRTHILSYLNPSILEDAKIIEDCFDSILKTRDLLPEEYSNYARALTTLSKYEKAKDMLVRSVKRYPGEPNLIYDLALAVELTGDQETAYQLCLDYMKLGSKSYAVLKSTAILADMTGRTYEAIRLFSRALSKSQDSNERGDIHCQLYELKRRTNSSPKDLIWHIHQFGKSIAGDDTAREARYLTMFLVTPRPETPDLELETWFEEAKQRLQAFELRHPKNQILRAFKIDRTLPPDQQAWDMLTTISSVTLPARMRGAQLEMAARSSPWALAFRASILSDSVFSYWSRCIVSKERSSAIHIWAPDMPLDEENTTARTAKSACVDITTLLVLAELDRLDLLAALEQLVVCLGTKRVLAVELENILRTPHPLSKRIDDWFRAHRDTVRVRRLPGSMFGVRDKENNSSNLLLPSQPSLDVTLPYGVGETVRLAALLGLPLYSDDVFARFIGLKDKGTKGFSTISMVMALREQNRIGLAEESEILAQMLNLNFRIVPFNSHHLSCSLEKLVKSYTESGTVLQANNLIQDEILGSLMRQFAEPSLDAGRLYSIAIDWWINILQNDFPMGTLEKTMTYPLFSFSQRTAGGVLTAMSKNEPNEVVGAILALFLFRTCRKDSKLTSRAWSAAKACCENYHKKEDGFRTLIFEKVPKWFVWMLDKDVKSENLHKVETLATFTTNLPTEDRELVEAYIVRDVRPRFLR